MLLPLLAGLSGFCALGYEVLLVRHLTTLLGDMLHVHAALLGTFLLGIAFGSRYAHRFHRWLFALEGGLGAYALALPWVTGWLGERAFLGTVTGSPLLSIITTSGLVAVPGFLVGFGLPLFSAYVKALQARDRAFQGVYVLYNLGAFGGVLAAELAMVKAFGVAGSLRTLGGINLAVGAALLAYGTRAFPRPPVPARSFRPRILTALALGSLASALFQMFFLKLTYLVFGPHRENFALSLAVVLLGIAVGTIVVARSRVRFSTLLVLLPLTLGSLFLLHPLLLAVHEALVPLAAGHRGTLVLLDLTLAGLYGLVPLALFGGLVPALMQEEEAVAEESGQLLWISGLANAGGYLLYVLLAHPLLPTQGLLLILGALALGGGLLAREGRWRRAEVAVAVTGLVALTLLQSIWREDRLYLAHLKEPLPPGTPVTTFKSGAESATLYEPPGYRAVSYNGHPSIFVSWEGTPNTAELVSGLIPALAAPQLDRAMVLGLGTGLTAGAAARAFREVDIVEINPAFLHMLPELSRENLAVGENPAAKVHVADARAFLVATDVRYDAILNSIPAPTYFSASKIYTLEFYEEVARALKPDGVFSTWLAVPEMTREGVLTVLGTLGRVFPHCDLRILRENYYMTTCSREPLETRSFSELKVGVRLEGALASGLPPVPLPRYFPATRISEDLFSEGWRSKSPPNTDDSPRLEFLLSRSRGDRAVEQDPFFEPPPGLAVELRVWEPGVRTRPFLVQARALRQLSPKYYRKYFRSPIRRHPELARVWAELTR